jgi:transcription elongation factor GreA
MPASFLTREGHQKLQEELEYLRTVKRQEVAERLHEAMEGGELIEDAEYEAAKNEQAFVEGRIQELEILLANARVIKETALADVVQVGPSHTKTVRMNRRSTIVACRANPARAHLNESPLGRALMDHRAGIRASMHRGSFVVQFCRLIGADHNARRRTLARGFFLNKRIHRCHTNIQTWNKFDWKSWSACDRAG